MGYIRKVLEGKQPAIKDSPNAVVMDDVAPRNGPSTIEFRNVTFSYADEGNDAPHVLRGISFSIRAGDNVALVGPSGSGKITSLHFILTLTRTSCTVIRQVHHIEAHHKNVRTHDR